MKSKFLKKFSDFLQKYKYLLFYGAGGVTKDLLILLKPYLNVKNMFIVVSDKNENEDVWEGYQVKEIHDFLDLRDEVYIVISVAPRYILSIENNLKGLGFYDYCSTLHLIEQLYREIWNDALKRDKIILANGDGYGFGGNPKYIAQELMKSGKKLDLVWITGNEELKMPDGVRTVQYGTYEHYWELGTAKIWIDNQHKNFFTRKRQGQVYIQTWHGGGPLKKIEFDAEGLPESYLDLCEMNSTIEDLMISPSKFNTQLYKNAFHYNGEIMECGYPRNDLFWRGMECKEKMRKLLGVKPEEGIVLFAPTYRKFITEDSDILDLGKARQALERRFGKKYKVLVRFHPFDEEPEKKYKWLDEWINVTSYDDVQELLVISDILITDYSSIMWDFSIQKKPVFLFHPDIKRYENERGYYLEFEKMPYIEAFCNDEIQGKIHSFDDRKYMERLSKFLEDYGTFDRGIASKMIAEKIFELIQRDELVSEERIEE